jgi:hypothetical protein
MEGTAKLQTSGGGGGGSSIKYFWAFYLHSSPVF